MHNSKEYNIEVLPILLVLSHLNIHNKKSIILNYL